MRARSPSLCSRALLAVHGSSPTSTVNGTALHVRRHPGFRRQHASGHIGSLGAVPIGEPFAACDHDWVRGSGVPNVGHGGDWPRSAWCAAVDFHARLQHTEARSKLPWVARMPGCRRAALQRAQVGAMARVAQEPRARHLLRVPRDSSDPDPCPAVPGPPRRCTSRRRRRRRRSRSYEPFGYEASLGGWLSPLFASGWSRRGLSPRSRPQSPSDAAYGIVDAHRSRPYRQRGTECVAGVARRRDRDGTTRPADGRTVPAGPVAGDVGRRRGAAAFAVRRQAGRERFALQAKRPDHSSRRGR
jgi:hypothetical protein